jgi:hypothetical protein
MVSCVVRIILIDRRYVESFMINSDNIEIKYLTAHLKAYSIQIPALSISGIELTKPNWMSEYPAAINIKHGENRTSYHIIQRKIFKEVKAKLTAANKGLPQAGIS